MPTATLASPSAAPSADVALHWVRFDDLSPIAQTAISHWDDEAAEDEVAEIIEGARGFEWQELVVTTESLIERIMLHPETAAHFGNWRAYHEWYLSDANVPDHGTSRWPVIEGLAADAAAGELTLDDGWHRFHSYVRAGDTHVPLLRRRVLD